MKKKLKLFIFLIILLQSCATFVNNSDANQKNDESNIDLFNGKYEVSSMEYQDKFDSYEYHNLFRELDRKILKDTLELDNNNTYHINLNFINNNRIKIDYLSNGYIFRSRIIKTKLKKDGYLYLKNKNVGFSLIPYLFGGLDVKRTRLSINEDENLVVEVSHFQGGAALLILFLDLGTEKYIKTYRRIY